MRFLTRTGVFAAAAAATVMVTASPALATDYNSSLHQATKGETPIAAADWKQGTCPGIGSDQDGWHFVATGQGATFVKLKVEFQNAGWVTVDTFGPPSDMHAYVATEPGDLLLDGKAKVVGGNGKDFKLSHTCAATPVDPADPADPTEDPTDPADPTEDPTDPTDPTEDPTDPADPADDPTDPADPADDPTDPADDPTDGVSGGDAGATPDGDGTDLAETGSSAPVLALSLGAAALLGAGAYLVVRRRNSAAQA